MGEVGYLMKHDYEPSIYHEINLRTSNGADNTEDEERTFYYHTDFRSTFNHKSFFD